VPTHALRVPRAFRGSVSQVRGGRNSNESGKATNMTLIPKRLHQPVRATMAHLDELLDEALKDTFPASDPVAINVELERPEQDSARTPPARGGKQGALGD